MARRKKGQSITGWIAVDKPVGLTSTQVVSRVREVFDARKIGHGGTLDPLASGILPIALGEATKTVSYITAGRKSYLLTVRWGQATTTDDGEGEIVEESDLRPDEGAILAVLATFIGRIEQVPPIFSAIKVSGRRAYEMARAKEEFELKPRPVEIYDIQLKSCPSPDEAVLEVQCGKGTYMRSLARDLGRALGTCAYVKALRRLSVGPFSQDNAISLDYLETLGHSPAALEQLLPLETALDDIPAIVLSEAEANRLRCGQPVSLMARMYRDRVEGLAKGDTVFVMTARNPVALTRYEAGEIHPVRVLNL